MKVLVACESSERVKRAFMERGHDAHSCDYKLGEQGLPNHHQCDVRDILYDGWDILIAHPDCTFLANSGVRWLRERLERWEEMREAALFFKLLLNFPIPKIAIENPIPHKYAIEIIGRKYDQIIQPWQFGHGETKATCLWLHNLPYLKPTNIVAGREGKVWKEPPSLERKANRSRTYQGIATAMAEQWG